MGLGSGLRFVRGRGRVKGQGQGVKVRVLLAGLPASLCAKLRPPQTAQA